MGKYKIPKAQIAIPSVQTLSMFIIDNKNPNATERNVNTHIDKIVFLFV